MFIGKIIDLHYSQISFSLSEILPSVFPNLQAVLDQFKADTEELREQQNQLADICDLIEEKFTDEKNTRIGDIVEDMDAGLSKSWKMNLMKLKKVLRTHKTPILVAGDFISFLLKGSFHHINIECVFSPPNLSLQAKPDRAKAASSIY